MPKTKKPEPITIAVILDRSGSMGGLQQATIDGYNRFVSEQEKHALISLSQFDDSPPTPTVEHDYVDVPVPQVVPLTTQTYQPRGGTPLMDAVGEVVTGLKARAPKGKVVVLIVTDGYENASREWTRERVFALVNERRQAGWQFVFMGADIDAYASSAAMAFSAGSTSGYAATPAGTAAAFYTASVATRSYTTGMSATVDMPQDTITGDDPAWVQPTSTVKVTEKPDGTTHITLR